MVKLVVFDFDGTVADSLGLVMKVMSDVAKDLGIKTLINDVSHFRNRPIQSIFKDLKVSLLKMPKFINIVKSELRKDIHLCKPIPGIQPVLKQLKEEGYKLGILTSNSRKNVSLFLSHNKIKEFDFIYADTEVFGKDKSFKDLLKKENFSKSEVIYLGDEIRDILAAKKAGIKVIAVAWGFNSKEILGNENPDFLVEKPKEILDIIKKS